jgi:hypothetical protein
MTTAEMIIQTLEDQLKQLRKLLPKHDLVPDSVTIGGQTFFLWKPGKSGTCPKYLLTDCKRVVALLEAAGVEPN